MFQTLAKIKKLILIFFSLFSLLLATVVFGYFEFPAYFSFIARPDILAYAAFGFMVIGIFVAFRVIRHMEIASRRTMFTIKNTLGADFSEAYVFGEIGMAVYNDNEVFIWNSELFDIRNIALIGEKVNDKFPALKPFFGDAVKKPKEIPVFYNQRKYSVMALPDLNLLVFKDITENERLIIQQKEQRVVFAFIVLDNLVDVTRYNVEEDVLILEQNIRKAIMEWGKKNNCYLRKEKDDTYFAILQESDFNNIAQDKFKIINDVYDMSRDNTITLTISIGIGRGTNDYIRLAELASSAIDVALSRGGNQGVVNNYGSNMEFFGGANTTKVKRSRVKTRVIAQSLLTHIQKSNQIFVVPHEQADFDAIGSALAMQKLCAATRRKAYIVVEENQIEDKARLALNEMFKKKDLNEVFISARKAMELLASEAESLVISVDMHRAVIATAPKLFEGARRVAIVDHHRRAEDAIDNPVFSYIEPSASSTCEVVIEIIKALDLEVEINEKIATYMLLGIYVDTNGFKGTTSSGTFEAAMYLKELGADNSTIENYLKEQYEEYILKTKILANMEIPYFGVVVASAPEDQIIDRTLLAKAGQEAVEVKGIKSVFVIGYIAQGIVGISARSDGSFNVQVVMEKLGGGGHYSSAGCQLKNTTIQAAKEKLIETMEIYELYRGENEGVK
ncbi:MAG: DHH family phosphoesterase [Bacilli bacterium]|nr:DHH family phosphoesterase [Bacilli bacterium]